METTQEKKSNTDLKILDLGCGKKKRPSTIGVTTLINILLNKETR